jgi:peptidoglycan/LPS O-acetylase OafA/YrhL
MTQDTADRRNTTLARVATPVAILAFLFGIAVNVFTLSRDGSFSGLLLAASLVPLLLVIFARRPGGRTPPRRLSGSPRRRATLRNRASAPTAAGTETASPP